MADPASSRGCWSTPPDSRDCNGSFAPRCLPHSTATCRWKPLTTISCICRPTVRLGRQGCECGFRNSWRWPGNRADFPLCRPFACGFPLPRRCLPGNAPRACRAAPPKRCGAPQNPKPTPNCATACCDCRKTPALPIRSAGKSNPRAWMQLFEYRTSDIGRAVRPSTISRYAKSGIRFLCRFRRLHE
jgi:hypothetical protein